MANDKKCPYVGGSRIQKLEGKDVTSCGDACRLESACVGFSVKTVPGEFQGVCMLCKSLTDLEDHAEFNFYKMTSSDDNSDNEPAMLGEGVGKKNKEDNDGFEISGIDARRNGRYYTKQDDTYASRGDPWYCKEDGSIKE